MKNISAIIIIASFLLQNSCKPDSNFTAITKSNKSVFNISINGHTYHDTLIDSRINYINSYMVVSYINYYNNYVFCMSQNFNITTPHISATFYADKLNITDTLGTYFIGYYTNPINFTSVSYGTIQLNDIADSNRYYTCYNDTSSNIVIKSYNFDGTDISATFNFKLLSNGQTYFASGDFHSIR